MRTRWTTIFAASALGALSAMATAAESGLLGIKLFDSGVRVVSLYGSPDDIQPVNVGGFGGGGGGGAAGGGMGPMGAPRGGGGAPMGAGAPTPGSGGPGQSQTNFSFGDMLLRQAAATGGGMKDLSGAAGPMGGTGARGPVGGGPGPSSGRGGAPPAGGGSAVNATYTRWVYNRSGSKYGFVIDKNGRVVQIEAIGLANGKVRTSKGVTFGNTFAQVIKKYQTPDGYDINGSNVLARYLNKQKVAFRFARLGPGKPQVVTGIVVAAGKG